ncbi:hypothetical protein KC959_01650 [Candidatus Saccharibacteria bacterium]|nr:hypothetical protein [Candidatus Saccharibacteria bacterium]
MARMSTGKKVLMAANVVALVGLAGSTGYLFMKNRTLNDQITLTTEEKNKRLVAEINEVFDLPDEEPVVAVVTDPEEFKKQYSAFDNANAGDYLLFFRKARLNVLYRQSEKRVVKTANVVVPIAVELVGSEDAIAAAEKKLAEFGNQISITKTVKDGITQSFVFDVDDDQKAEAESIAKQLGYEIGATLPSSISPVDQTEIVIAVTSEKTTAPAETTETTPQEP